MRTHQHRNTLAQACAALLHSVCRVWLESSIQCHSAHTAQLLARQGTRASARVPPRAHKRCQRSLTQPRQCRCPLWRPPYSCLPLWGLTCTYAHVRAQGPVHKQQPACYKEGSRAHVRAQGLVLKQQPACYQRRLTCTCARTGTHSSSSLAATCRAAAWRGAKTCNCKVRGAEGTGAREQVLKDAGWPADGREQDVHTK